MLYHSILADKLLFLEEKWVLKKLENIRYLRITDTQHNGEIVKQIGRKFYGFVDGKWKRRGMCIGYFIPEAPEFECYEEISEYEALRLVGAI